MTEIFAAIFLTLLGAPSLHLDESMATKASRNTGAYYAAAGESIQFALRLENDGVERRLLSCEIVWDDDAPLGAAAYRPAVDDDFQGGIKTLPDACVPLGPLDLSAESVQVITVVVRVPVPMPAEQLHGEARAIFEDGETARCDISLQILDFELPVQPTLSVLFSLDGPRLASELNIAVEALEQWTPFYDALSDLGIGYRLNYPVEPQRDITQDHMIYVAATTPGSVVDLGGTPGALDTYFFQPTAFSPQDPLQTLIQKRLEAFTALNTRRLPVVQPNLFGPRPTWHRIRQSYARFARADERLARILAAPLHPNFERYTEIWALPEATSSGLMNLLMGGESIVRYDQSAVALCVGSAGALDASGHYQTLASETVDGSEATVWSPSSDTNVPPSPWIEYTFRDLLRVESLTMLGNLGPDQRPVVETAYNPGEFSEASVSWERASRQSESGLSVLVGTFRYPRECCSVRLRFEGATARKSVVVAEVLFNNTELAITGDSIPPVVPWLDGSDSTYFAWTPSADGALDQARSLPWRCWALGFRGVLGPVLNAAEKDATPLIGMGKGQLLPSQRLFSFRDGLEDFEYLRLYWERVGNGSITAPADFVPGLGEDAFDRSVGGEAQRNDLRVRIGRLLSGETTVTKNFGPRKPAL